MKLDVNQDTVGTVFGGVPSINTKKVSTQVLVDNGGTVVVGGVFTQDFSDSIQKVPLLGDVPIIGWLFKNDVKSDNRQELLIFITPRSCRMHEFALSVYRSIKARLAPGFYFYRLQWQYMHGTQTNNRKYHSGNLILVGMMGSGKTTMGRALAKHLGKEFVDSDEAVQQRTGVTIPHIFDVEGEPAFECAKRQRLPNWSSMMSWLLRLAVAQYWIRTIVR